MTRREKLARALRTAWQSGTVDWWGLADIALAEVGVDPGRDEISSTVVFTWNLDGTFVPHFSFPETMSPAVAIETVRKMYTSIGLNLEQSKGCPLHGS
jgi:hypothetical protein